jgi:hypothetical protein
MPKSRQRKKRSKPTRSNRGYEVVKLTDEMKAALETQIEAFRKKFGREPGPKDPIFFDPIGASIGGFLATSVLGLHFVEGFNLATIAVATAGAVLLLAIFGGIRQNRVT